MDEYDVDLTHLRHNKRLYLSGHIGKYDSTLIKNLQAYV